MTGKFADKTVAQFLDELASKAPVPGGGSGAALAGALGAALASMVGNLTAGKSRYADVQDEIENLLAQTEALRARLTDLIEEDIAAYYKLSSAYKMPRDTDEQKATRSAAIQSALREATQPPMAIAEACVEVLRLSKPLAEIGNVNAVSDAGVAALLAEAALRSAALNILINLGSIKDEEFVNWGSKNLNRLLDGTAALKEEIYELVVSKL